MPRSLDVEKKRFAFDASWPTVFKYDDTDFYRDGPERLKGALTKYSGGVATSRPQGTRAVDLIALNTAGGLLLLEAKDFRGYQAENTHRLSGEVCLELALKVLDTIAGLVGAGRMAVTEFPSAHLATALQNSPDLMIVLWLEDDLFANPAQAALKLGVLTNVLKTKLAWLNAKTLVISSSKGANNIPGVSASDLP
jgi:hypothetical protein